ncbi:MAG TPA: L,D-transpeptidase family protein [Acidimicrobiales bacterium]|nr:L,D-transpeptidase family protein [Acidimicrobiales bacterium]
MIRRLKIACAVAVVSLTSTILPSLGASGATIYRVSATFPATLSVNLPLLRLHFSAPTKATSLPPLFAKPSLLTKWQQIGPSEVQAIALGPLKPMTSYTFFIPSKMRCASSCRFSASRPRVASVSTNLTWEVQLLAELKYLPVTFTPTATQSAPSEQVSGTFAWAYPDLPATLRSQWRLGSDNAILRGAVMNFQSRLSLPTTGEADAATWSALLSAVDAHHVNPASYNYVDVSTALPQTLTLYVAGHAKFHALVNTGISVAPTALGTYPVYVRYLTTTMSGTNPDGSHYSDPGIPWVSYFNGGDALHGFIRSTYGWPQSLGCVEMTFASAQTVFPFTPIGTLVTVHA